MIPGMQQTGNVDEFTLKAVAIGIVLGIVFGAANAYLGLRVGMTVSASIPAAVMTVAAFSLLRTKGTILEANLSQTVASAGGRAIIPDRDAVGGPNKKRVPVKIGPNDIAEFQKGIA